MENNKKMSVKEKLIRIKDAFLLLTICSLLVVTIVTILINPK